MIRRVGRRLVLSLILAATVLAFRASPALADEDEDDVILEDEGTSDTADETAGPTHSTNALFRGSYQSLLGIDTSFDGNQEDVIEWRNRLELSISMDVTPTLRVVASGRMNYWLALEGNKESDDFREETTRAVFEGSLRDTYLLWSVGSGFDLALGYRTFTWGRTDFSQPLDVLNPLDLRDGMVDQSATNKEPIFSFEISKSMGDLNLSLVWIPFFSGHKIDLFGTDWSIMEADLPVMQSGNFSSYMGILDALHPTRYEELQGLFSSTQDPPQDGFTGADAGLRMTGNWGGVDLGLAYVYQWDRLPVIRKLDFAGMQVGFTGILGTGNKQANLEQIRRSLDMGYERRHVAGGDFEWTTGVFTLKGDVAYSHPRTFYVEQEEPIEGDPNGETEPSIASIRKPSLAWAFQVDAMPGAGLFFSLEFSGSHVLSLEENVQLLLLKKTMYRISALAQWRFGGQEQFRLQVVGLLGLTQNDGLLMPQFTWRLSPLVGLDLGASLTLADPNELSAISLFDRNDFAYVRANLSF
jgi:hypothetical protein